MPAGNPVRLPIWHEQQKKLLAGGKPSSLLDGLHKAGTDWAIKSVPVRYTNPATGEELEDPIIRLNAREDTGFVLGRVTKDYNIFQNIEAFSSVQKLLEQGAELIASESLQDGRLVYVLVRWPGVFTIGGDEHELLGFITNHHGGWKAAQARVAFSRIVSGGVLSPKLLSGVDPVMKLNHVGEPGRAALDARVFTNLTQTYAGQFKTFGEQLAADPADDIQLNWVLDKLWPEPARLTDRQKQNKRDAKDFVRWLYREGPSRGAKPGTWWTALNAIVEYVDFGASGAGGKLLKSLDDPTGLKQKATHLIMTARS
jgi:hypothetical protein